MGFILICRCCFAEPITNTVQEPEVVDFNESFVHGTGIDVARFSRANPVDPGIYKVEINVNGVKQGQDKIRFKVPARQSNAEACFTLSQLKQIGITPRAEKQNEAMDKCDFISDWVAQGSTNYNSSDFILNIIVPQINIVNRPKGYIDPSRWDQGTTVGFLDYNGNVYSSFQNKNEQGNSNNTDANLSFSTGLNIAGWRLRKNFSSNWDKDRGFNTNSLYSYAAHDVPALNSEAKVGEIYTSGDLFDSNSIRGAMLNTNMQMLPDVNQSYSPSVRGVAETNAKVTIMQRGYKLYETTVPPGAFELNDFGAMGYGGNIELIITESDGRQRRQIIPFSAPPGILKEGVTKYSVVAGQLRDTPLNKHPNLFEGTMRYGLFNDWTIYGGAQIGENYYSAAVGNAFNTILGGISLNFTHARSDLLDGSTSSGNSYSINYSKYLTATDTNLTLGAYRYQSKGFYTYRDLVYSRERSLLNSSVSDFEHSNLFLDYRTKSQFTAAVSQKILDNLSLRFSGSLYSYWDDRSVSRQYSLTMDHGLKFFSYSLTANRAMNRTNQTENTFLVTVMVPLSNGSFENHPLFSNISSTASHSNEGNTYFQTRVNGSQGYQNALSYGLSTDLTNTKDYRNRAVSGDINYNTGVGNFGATASANSNHNQQFSIQASGSVVAHSGGITLGPSLGSAPFAIVQAKNAQGARVNNGYGGQIDSHGFAIMPSLMPYRENSVALDTKGLADDVDVLENEVTVVPASGAAVKVVMKTVSGKAMILTLYTSEHTFLPIGTDLLSNDPAVQSIVGPGGQAFIRGWNPETQPLFANVNGKKQQCVAQSSTGLASTEPFLRVEVKCN